MTVKRAPIPILMYHSISVRSSHAPWPYAVHPQLFADHMWYLSDQGYSTLTVSRLVDILGTPKCALPARPIVLTFDDGFADFNTTALPVLQGHHFSATVYIPTAYVGGTSWYLTDREAAARRVMSWSELMEISVAGIECGAHSHTHPHLDMLPTAAAREEITLSREILAEKLGREVRSFAYPYGHFHAVHRAMVEQAGYSSACAVRHAMSSTDDDRLALARIMVSADTTNERLARLVAGQGLRIAPMRDRIFTRTYLRQILRRSRARLRRLLPD